MGLTPHTSDEVLVAIMRDRLDFSVLQNQGWYRIPVDKVRHNMLSRWPPKWLALYQTKVFGSDAFSVRHFGRVIDVRKVQRRELFPDEPMDEKSARYYYQVFVDHLGTLPNPIPSRRLRRVVFIPTTWGKLSAAEEINDLFDDSPLEDDLWSCFKAKQISAERQERIDNSQETYFLDFAIYCAGGRLNVEADGDTYHANPEQAASDNLRDNWLHKRGWSILRFSTPQIRDSSGDYCIRTVTDTINRLGGLETRMPLPNLIPNEGLDGSYQMNLFSQIKDAS